MYCFDVPQLGDFSGFIFSFFCIVLTAIFKAWPAFDLPGVFACHGMTVTENP